MRDLVLVKYDDFSKEYLFEAPAYSGLKEGDYVEVENKNGRAVGMVTGVVTTFKDDKTEALIIRLMKATLPLKRVVATFKKQEVAYHE